MGESPTDVGDKGTEGIAPACCCCCCCCCDAAANKAAFERRSVAREPTSAMITDSTLGCCSCESGCAEEEEREGMRDVG